MAKVFDGLKVIDFTQVIAGPYASYQLALQGADVIKVEHPKGGDQGRVMMSGGPEFSAAMQSTLFMSFNAGKRSLALDLKHPQALEVLKRLVAEADVVVENFKAGQMDKLGLGYDVLRQANPKIVYCSISGFGCLLYTSPSPRD